MQASMMESKQNIHINGHQFQLDFKIGISLLAHVVMTSGVDWDPKIYENDLDSFSMTQCLS
jgi:hypothetical protein